MGEQCSGTGGRRRRHTKKHHRRSRHRSRRGGAALADFRGVETYPGGHIDVRAATGISGSSANQNASSYDQNTAGSYASYGGRRRRTRRHRHRRSRHRMRGGDAFSPMGGDGKGGVTAGWSGESIGAPAVSARVYDATTNR